MWISSLKCLNPEDAFKKVVTQGRDIDVWHHSGLNFADDELKNCACFSDLVTTGLFCF